MKMNEIAAFLKALRKSKGLTQVELADMLNVSNKTVSKWENGLGIPEMSTLLLLSDIYEVSVDDILRGSKKMHQNEDKPIDRFRYLLHKSKHQYINHLILSFAVLVLGVLAFFATDALVESMVFVIAVTIAFVLISFVIQVFNIIRIRYQLIEIENTVERSELLKYVLHSSFIVLFIGIWLSYFTFIRNAYWLIDNPLDAWMYSSIIPAFAIAIFHTLLIYVITRFILRSKIDIKLSKIQSVFLTSLIVLIITPLIVLTIFPARDVAIAVDWSGVSLSTYQLDEQEDRYYRLKLLWLLDKSSKEGVDPSSVYDIVMIPNGTTSFVPAVHYRFTDPTNYDLNIKLSYFEDFLLPHDYSNFIVSDESISAYYFQKSDVQLSFEIYGYLTGNLLLVWLVAGIGVIIVSNVKKEM